MSASEDEDESVALDLDVIAGNHKASKASKASKALPAIRDVSISRETITRAIRFVEWGDIQGVTSKVTNRCTKTTTVVLDETVMGLTATSGKRLQVTLALRVALTI